MAILTARRIMNLVIYSAGIVFFCQALNGQTIDNDGERPIAEIESKGSYKCHYFSQEPLVRTTFVWDGTVPYLTALRAGNTDGYFRIQNIGMAGRPEYLFDIKVGERIIFSMSQKAGLTDYTMIWKSAVNNGGFSELTITCSVTGVNSSGEG